MKEKSPCRQWYDFLALQSLYGQSWGITDSLKLLADSFETRFNPFTLEAPRVSAPIYYLASVVAASYEITGEMVK
jgi:hypothetical protein